MKTEIDILRDRVKALPDQRFLDLARLAELAERISDAGLQMPRFDVDVEYCCSSSTPTVTVTLRSWRDGFPHGRINTQTGQMNTASDRLKVIEFRTPLYSDDPDYTTGDLIAILEQIEHYGFRSQQEQAA